MTRPDFFAQLAALERATRLRVGAAHPRLEPVRFVPEVTLAFAATDMAPSPDDPRDWVTSFLGLAGADGALPPYLAEEIAREDPDRAARRALLTPFHHRATSLLHRSVHRCRVPEETRSRDDAWPTRLASLVRGEPLDDPFDREVALALAPLLLGPPSGSSLARALRVVSARWLDGAAMVLTERTGERAPLDPAHRTRLGRTRLGDTAMLGGSVLDAAGRATLTIGPVSARVAPALAPGGAATRAVALATRWLGDAFTEIEVVLRVHDAPSRLGASTLGGSALGRQAMRPRRLALDATTRATVREGCRRSGPQRPPKELPCERTRDPSSSD